MENNELINAATAVLHTVTDSKSRVHGDVGAAVLGKNGKLYVGVCVDTPGWGLCAERNALASMITDGEYKFEKVVAVWKNDKTGNLHVLPPCGICRQFMRDINGSNMESSVILDRDKTVMLKELIPYHEWPAPLG